MGNLHRVENNTFFFWGGGGSENECSALNNISGYILKKNQSILLS